MEDVARKNTHKKKKKKYTRSSSASSAGSGRSSSGEEAPRKRSQHREERSREGEQRSHRKEDRGREKHRRELERSKYDSRDHRKEVSPEASRDRSRSAKDERSKETSSKHRSDKGSRWEDEERRYDRASKVRVKAEPESEQEEAHAAPLRRDQDRGEHRRSHRERGGFDSGRGRGRGRGRGGRGNMPWGRNGGDNKEDYQWGRQNGPGEGGGGGAPQIKVEKEKPNFGLSGKLTEDANTVNGVVVKYSEPPESRKPKRRWRLYVFKGEETLPTLYIHRQSAYLMGRDRKVADIPLDHPSVSKQHAALQYRLVTFKRDDGISTGKCIRPYIIDLESANGTFVNNKKIEPKKYVQLMEKDVLKFGFSSREYVLLHEHSQDTNSGDDDDVNEGPNP